MLAPDLGPLCLRTVEPKLNSAMFVQPVLLLEHGRLAWFKPRWVQTSWPPFPASGSPCPAPAIFIPLQCRVLRHQVSLCCPTSYPISVLLPASEQNLIPCLLRDGSLPLLQPHFSLHLSHLMAGPLHLSLLCICSCLSSFQNCPPALPLARYCSNSMSPIQVSAYCLVCSQALPPLPLFMSINNPE